MLNFIKKYGIASLVVILVTASIVVSFYNRRQKRSVPSFQVAPSVTRVEPLLNTSNVGPAPDIVVYFDGDLKVNQASLKSSPKVSFTNTRRAEAQIVFRPKTSLQPNTTYSLTVYFEQQPRFSWKVTTKNFSVDASYAEKVNKVKAAIPYKTAKITLSYDPPLDQYFAYINGTPVDTYKTQVQEWFKSFGINDLSPLNIFYIQVKP